MLLRLPRRFALVLVVVMSMLVGGSCGFETKSENGWWLGAYLEDGQPVIALRKCSAYEANLVRLERTDTKGTPGEVLWEIRRVGPTETEGETSARFPIGETPAGYEVVVPFKGIEDQDRIAQVVRVGQPERDFLVTLAYDWRTLTTEEVANVGNRVSMDTFFRDGVRLNCP